MVGHMAGVEQVADVAAIEDAGAYRSPLVPEIETNGLSVQAASVDLPAVTATAVAAGRFLNAATATQPVAVLGAEAARRLGIGRVHRDGRIWVGGQWFAVAGILAPSELASEIDTSVLVGYTAAQRFLGYVGTASGEETIGPPTKIYVRAQTGRVEAVQALLARTANPEAPTEVDVSQPSDTLTARAAAQGALDSLFLGLGAVALLVGAVGVANIMIIAVLERRSEIGLRRALGATRGQIRLQFLSEAILLALAGGAVGVAAGAVATAVYATGEGWAVVIPASAWGGGLVSALLIGAIAGLAPAVRAARMSPTEALRSV
jgi:putative ABC transport system permease protein